MAHYDSRKQSKFDFKIFKSQILEQKFKEMSYGFQLKPLEKEQSSKFLTTSLFDLEISRQFLYQLCLKENKAIGFLFLKQKGYLFQNFNQVNPGHGSVSPNVGLVGIERNPSLLELNEVFHSSTTQQFYITYLPLTLHATATTNLLLLLSSAGRNRHNSQKLT